jgi:hypothetical protein
MACCFCYNHAAAEVNLAWWLAWTSNPVVVHREVGLVGSIPMHLRHFCFQRVADFPLLDFSFLRLPSKHR